MLSPCKRKATFLLSALSTVAREVRQGVVGDGELRQSKDNDLMEANQGRLSQASVLSPGAFVFVKEAIPSLQLESPHISL